MKGRRVKFRRLNMKENIFQFEIRFYEGILKESPFFVQALIALGDAYTKNGMFKEGLVVDKKLSKLRPDDEVVFYNLACDYSLLKDAGGCLSALRKAIKLGYSDFAHMQKDPDLAFIRRDPRYKQLAGCVEQNGKVRAL